MTSPLGWNALRAVRVPVQSVAFSHLERMHLCATLNRLVRVARSNQVNIWGLHKRWGKKYSRFTFFSKPSLKENGHTGRRGKAFNSIDGYSRGQEKGDPSATNHV
jgi:hypothetical protein